MYLLQGQRLDWGEGGAAAYEDVAEVRAAGFGSSSAPPTHSHSQFFLFPFSFSGRSLCLLLSHVLLPSLFAHLFFQHYAFHFCPPASFIFCLFLSCPWLGMYEVHFKCKWCRLDWYKFCAASSNLFKGKLLFHSVLLLSVCEVFPYWNTQTPIKMRFRWLGRNWNLFHIMHCFIVAMRISRFNFCLFVLLILPD